MQRRTKQLIGIFAMVCIAIVATVYWNEARKEIVFLCGNFVKGVPKSSVLAQLDTGNFLQYRAEQLSDGSRIVADSKLNFSIYQCTIYFDSNDMVTRAYAE